MKNKWIEIFAALLMAATVIAGFLTTTDVALIPEEYRKYLPMIIGGIIVLKQLAYGALDYLDDGLLNKSYKTPSTLLKVLLCLLLPVFLLSSCANNQSTDAEIRRAQGAIEAAQFTHSLAVVVYGPRLADPKTSPAEKLVATQIIEDSRKRLATEEARLADIQARRAAAAVAAQTSGEVGPPATLLLPPLTEAK